MQPFASLATLFIIPWQVEPIDFVDVACLRNKNLPFCHNHRRGDIRRAPPRDPFEENVGTRDKSKEASAEKLGSEEFLDVTTFTPYRTTTLPTKSSTSYNQFWKNLVVNPPIRRNIFIEMFPAMQKNKNPRQYCPLNQYTFQVTCLPGKKLRFDLQVFCQEYSDTCGVPNVLLMKSMVGRDPDDGRPKGYGQKQKSGTVGMGRSFAMGIGVVPGLEITGSHGTEVGNGALPFFDQVGGFMINEGVDLGALGQKTGRGAARALAALTRGFPTLGMLGKDNENEADKTAAQHLLQKLGFPRSLDHIGSLIKGSDPKTVRMRGYQPGYGAVDRTNPLAFGKVDHDEFNVPGGLGDVEWNRGYGFGFGK